MTKDKPRILAIDDTPANLITLGTALAGEYDLQFSSLISIWPPHEPM